MKLLATTSLCLALSALGSANGQTCTPGLVGLPTGPYEKGSLDIQNFVADMMLFNDGSGPSLVVGGDLYLPDVRDFVPSTSPEIYASAPAARYQNGRWTVMPDTFGYEALYLAQADFSSLGGTGASIYAMLRPMGESYAIAHRWSGSAWSPVGNAPNTGLSLLSHSDAQGPVLLMGGANSQGILAWRGSGPWASYAPFTRTSGAITRLRHIDDGTGMAVFAMGSMRDNSRNLRALIKLVNGEWTQYDMPAGALSAGDVTDIATFDDGTSTTGPEVYIAWRTTTGSSVARRRLGVWETLATNVPSSNLLVGSCLRVANVQGVSRLYHAGSVPLREWTAAGWSVPFTTRYSSSLSNGVIGDVVNFDDGNGEETYFGGSFTDFFEGTVSYPQDRATPAYGLIRTSDQGLISMSRGYGHATTASGPQLTYLSGIELPEGPRLIVGGPIQRAGGQYANGVAMFDGASWFNFNATTQNPMAEVRSATTALINGQACIVASRIGAVYYWNGTLWQPLPSQPTTGSLTTLLSLGGSLYASGPTLQRFTGSSWETVATLPPFQTINAPIVADLGNGPRIVFGTNNGVCEFDSGNITRVGPTTVAVSQVAVVNDGPGPRVYIYAAGLTNKIARLTNGVWEELPPGVHNTSGSTGFAIASFDDGNGPALYVAGHRSSTEVRGAVARWHDNAWSVPTTPLGSTQTDMLNTPAMVVVGDRLYIAGSFSRIGSITADHLAYIQACPHTCNADYNADGDNGTDADIEAFFRCLAGDCCTRCAPDFNNDGQIGTDADIESFFRVLAGGAC